MVWLAASGLPRVSGGPNAPQRSGLYLSARGGVGPAVRLFVAVVLVVGAAVCGLPYLSYLSDVPPAEYAVEARASGIGALLLFSPYVALAAFSLKTKLWAGCVALLLLLVGSAGFLLVASSDPQGALIAFYILPAQWLVAVFSGDDRFRRSARARALKPAPTESTGDGRRRGRSSGGVVLQRGARVQ